MSWKKIKQKYDEAHTAKKEYRGQSYEHGYQLVMKRIRKNLPEALKKPYLLRNPHWGRVFTKYYGTENSATFIELAALRSLMQILETQKRKHNPAKAVADKKIFSTTEVMACLLMWLQNNGWKNTDAPLIRRGTNLSMKKGNIILAAEFMSSERGNSKNEYFTFIQKTGGHITALIEVMRNNSNIIPVLAIPDDIPTVKSIMPYKKYFNKLGIKIYLVKSAKQVRKI